MSVSPGLPSGSLVHSHSATLGSHQAGFSGASEPQKAASTSLQAEDRSGLRSGVSQSASLLWAEDTAGLQQGLNLSMNTTEGVPTGGRQACSPAWSIQRTQILSSKRVLGHLGLPWPREPRAVACSPLVSSGRQQVVNPAPSSCLQNPGRSHGHSEEWSARGSGVLGLRWAVPQAFRPGGDWGVPWAPTGWREGGSGHSAGSAFGHKSQDTRLQRWKQRDRELNIYYVFKMNRSHFFRAVLGS